MMPKPRFDLRYTTLQGGSGLAALEVSEMIAYAVGPYYVLTSDDQGRTWTNRFPNPPRGNNPAGIYASGRKAVLRVEEGPYSIAYFLTLDAGLSWLEHHRLTGGGYVFCSMSSDPMVSRVWSLIEQRNSTLSVHVWDTKSGLTESIPLRLQGNMRQVACLDETSAYLLGQTYHDPNKLAELTASQLYFSRDSGHTWRLQSEVTGCFERLFVGPTASRLIAVGSEGIVVSNNCGIDWTQVFGNPRVPLFDIHMCGSRGIALGTEGLIETHKDILLLISNDAGESWSEIAIPEVSCFIGARLINNDRGILAASNLLFSFDLAK